MPSHRLAGSGHLLHVGFGSTFVLGPFAWALCVFSTLLFTREDWEVAERTMRKPEREVVVLRGCPRLLSCSYAPLLPVALALVWLGAWFADLSAGLV